MLTLPLAFGWIDWMSPLMHSFVLVKLLLLPAVGVYALHQRRRAKRTGVQPHESEAEAGKPARPLWVNHSLAQDTPPPAPPSDPTRESPPAGN
ncbi:MAG: hypothetical protein ACRDKI_02355 [Solirubrobacterales bacterium]